MTKDESRIDDYFSWDYGHMFRGLPDPENPYHPGTLYHYTGAAGLEGILNSRALHATNFSFLNDPTELLYGKGLVERIAKQQEDGRVVGLFRIAQDNLENQLAEAYMFCFWLCDDLSQWRAYGGHLAQERYCIGFELESLHNHDSLICHDVIYEHEKQYAEVLKILDVVKNNKDNSDAELIAERAAYHLARLIPKLKYPAYSNEEEWRIIRWISRDKSSDITCEDICFDVSRGFVRPFLKIQLAIKPLPIVDLIVMAPGREAISLKAADMLLRKHGINVKSRLSTVPFVG